MIRKYSYQCRDYSVLTPIFKKYLVEPLIVLIPISIPANIITIVSNLFVYLSVTLSFIYGSDFRWNFILIPISLTIYVIGDHLDGLQAKRTGTSSALGEFWDHFLDTFNTGLILVIMFQLFNVKNDHLMIYLMTTSYLAHASIFYHQFKTGWLVFEKFGSLEAMCIITILLFLSFFPGVYDLLTTELWKFTIIKYLLILSSVGAIATFTKTMVDTKALSLRWLWYFFLFILLSLFLAVTDPGIYVYPVLILYPSLYIGGLMQ
jgi:ethanolaminephosphotransferase